jgi:hypothetical protein
VTAIDATFRLYCEESHDDGRPSELWLAREVLADGRRKWTFHIPARLHGRDWGGPRAIKVAVQHLSGDVFLTKEMREPYSEFSFSSPVAEFSDTSDESSRVNFRFECPTCGISPPVRGEKLARILDRQIAAGKPDMTLRGLDYLLKLLP